jgi:hypothetical protein
MWFGAGLIEARAFQANKICGAVLKHSEKAESDKHAFKPADVICQDFSDSQPRFVRSGLIYRERLRPGQHV